MKKTYQAPSVEVTKIGATQMICESIDGFNSTLGSDGKDGGAALGRERGTRNDGDSFEDLW